MGLFKFIKRQLLEVIEWQDDTKNTIVYRYPLTDRDEIMNSSTLVVRPSQVALFVHKGEVADVFTPGTYKLASENIPFLTKMLSLPTGFNSPIKAEVYFINTKQFNGLKWGTQNPIMMRDPEFGNVRIRGYGIYGFKVNDAKVLMQELYGTNSTYTVDDINGILKPMVVQGITNAIAKSKISALDFAANYENFSSKILSCLKESFSRFGIKPISLVIENISVPEEVEKTLDERTKMGVMEDKMNTFTKFQAAQAMREAANNQGSGNLAGLGVGLGAGTGIGQLFSESMNNSSSKNSEEGKTCIKCGAKIRKNAKYCPECGSKQVRTCPKCGAELNGSAKYCPECGAKITK